MEIKPDTKLMELLKKYPFLIEFLANYNPEYAKIRNPIIRNTMGRIATLNMVASMGNVPVEKLIDDISKAISESQTSDRDLKSQKESLKNILRQLHEGKSPEELKADFTKLAKDVTPSEIGAIEQELVKEGLDPQEIKRLCNLHVLMFQEAMEKKMPAEFPHGHPLRLFQNENKKIQEAIDDMKKALSRKDKSQLKIALNNISELLNSHYTRKENILFPLLEKHGITAPPQVMWGVHDDIRDMLKQSKESLDKGDIDVFLQISQKLITESEGMINKEENILFPMLMETLTEEEWIDVEKSSSKEYTLQKQKDLISLDVGKLTEEQINLILKNLPVDVTFVDENDEVRYYSDKERIFPRFPNIISRKVQNCHPPKSLHVVQKIIDEFKAGRKNVAEFWIKTNQERLIHIRYFALRDSNNNYRGILEVSQDITDIKNLQGERRLLDWE